MMIYSAASLQDFVDCRRRFQLRYLQKIAWPAIETEPVLESERFMEQGARFHRFVQQHQSGISSERLEAMIVDNELKRWWKDYLTLVARFSTSSRCYSEASLTASLAGARFVAHCDLIQVSPDDRLVIYDWKTSRRRPNRSWLRNRLQTRLYPTLIALSGAYLTNGKPIQPDQIEMVYWFADFPDRPERFQYDRQQFDLDQAYLAELVGEIIRLADDEYILTSNQMRCNYCVYRSLCERGTQAGTLEDLEAGIEDIQPFSIEFDQIPEIEF
jgi:hypothetical protein